VIAADRGRSIRESFSMAKAYSEAREEHGESELLDEMVSAKPEMDSLTTRRRRSSRRTASSTSAMPWPCSSRRPRARRSMRKAFILGLAQRVAEARKEGFMGLSGERVSEAEREGIGEISGALA
jgi:hypothetical protein